MNLRTCICVLAAGTLAACGQPPVHPKALRAAETTTTAGTTATSTTSPPTTTTTTPAPPPPPPPRTTTTKPPPPPPKPPTRLVLTADLRGSLEQRTGQQFPGSWAGMQSLLAELCPDKKLCVGYTLVVDPSIKNEQDCFIPNGGISVPDPLYVGGKITFRVNNKKCPKV